MQLDATSEAIKGTVVIAGTTASVMSPNELASFIAAVLTAIFVVAQLVTLLPKMLDSIQNLRARFRSRPVEAEDDTTK
jgi:hypothetical protein